MRKADWGISVLDISKMASEDSGIGMLGMASESGFGIFEVVWGNLTLELRMLNLDIV